MIKVTIDPQRIITEYRNTDISVSALAKKHRIGSARMAKVLREMGVTEDESRKRGQRIARRISHQVCLDEFERVYRKKCSISHTADHFGIPITRARRIVYNKLGYTKETVLKISHKYKPTNKQTKCPSCDFWIFKTFDEAKKFIHSLTERSFIYVKDHDGRCVYCHHKEVKEQQEQARLLDQQPTHGLTQPQAV